MENTPKGDSRQEFFDDFPSRLRGIPGPHGLLCRVPDIRRESKISPETWGLWLEAGLEEKLIDLGSDTLFVFTNDVQEFAASRPKLGERRSAVRKRELAARKRKK